MSIDKNFNDKDSQLLELLEAWPHLGWHQRWAILLKVRSYVYKQRVKRVLKKLVNR